MNRKDIYKAIGQADNDILERSEKNKRKKGFRKPWWAVSVAAVLVIAIAAGILLPVKKPLITTVYAVAKAEFPEMAPYPDETSPSFAKDYEAWHESVSRQYRETGYANGLEPFFASSIRTFLSDSHSKNKAYSPLNVYMALGMLAEVTDGESRQQILTLLGSPDIDALRAQANDLWNAHYQNDTATTSILASSLWMNENISFHQPTLDSLAKNYYASAYQGAMGSDKFNKALQTWLTEQTGGLLEKQASEVTMDPGTIMALATTIYFQAKWSDEFREINTVSETFHSPVKDVSCDFMHSSHDGTYYWGNQFGAVTKTLANGGGKMNFILPDEDVAVDELLADDEVMNFILSSNEWENAKHLIINLALPKFDITSQMNLNTGLKSLGITDVFDDQISDFTPLTSDTDDIFLSQVQHDVRVAVDEEGVTAAAYTVMLTEGSAMPPDEEIDFVLDRPFLFVITSRDGLPLFAGVVNEP